MYSLERLAEIEAWLKARRASKLEIMKNGSKNGRIEVSVHSSKDIDLIDFALKRIKYRQFGLCTECGSLIEEARINVKPETPVCLHCAHNIENFTTKRGTLN